MKIVFILLLSIISCSSHKFIIKDNKTQFECRDNGFNIRTISKFFIIGFTPIVLSRDNFKCEYPKDQDNTEYNEIYEFLEFYE